MNNTLDKSYAARVMGDLTFWGVLSDHYKEIFPRCNDKTLKEYANTFNHSILPELGNIPIAECTDEKLDSTLEKLQNKKEYAPGTVKRFEYLMEAVVACAVKMGYCADTLFGTPLVNAKKASKEELMSNELQQNRKSLSPNEEVQVLDNLLVPVEKTSGTNVGLLCMLALGLRNHEACGLTFEAIRKLKEGSDIYVAWIYESTAGRTSNLQTSGKTRNMARKIPLYPSFAEYLLALKAYRQRQIDQGEIVLEEGESLDTLPIVWKKSNFKQHCTSDLLTTAGRALLFDIDFEQDRILALRNAATEKVEEEAEEIAEMDDAIEDESVSLKDPTAYLLRRNFGTHLAILGFSDEKIAYLMGHKLEAEGLTRNMFSNEDRLEEIFYSLNKRPLFGSNCDPESRATLSSSNQTIALSNVPDAKVNVQSSSEEITAKLRLSAKELATQTKVIFRKPSGAPPIQLILDKYPKPMNTNGGALSVNILRMYQETYRTAKGKKKLFDRVLSSDDETPSSDGNN